MAPECKKHFVPKKWIKDRSRTVGGKWRCPECAKRTMSDYRERNAETLPEIDRQRMADRRADPETNEKIKGSRRASAKRRREVMNSVSRIDPIYLSEEGMRMIERKERENEVGRMKGAIRRAREKDAMCPHCEASEYQNHTSGTCYICSSSLVEHVDHVLPISRGGLHCNDNLLGACAQCNLSKSYRTWPGHPGWEDFISEKRRSTW
jgi:5-methylcytosine-specific restriction endonuclease McrA